MLPDSTCWYISEATQHLYKKMTTNANYKGVCYRIYDIIRNLDWTKVGITKNNLASTVVESTKSFKKIIFLNVLGAPPPCWSK